MGVSGGLSAAILFGVLLSGVVGQGKVTKGSDRKLVFQDLQPYCSYQTSELLEATPESAAFGNIAAGIVSVVAPGTVQSLIEIIDPEEIRNNPNGYLQENWRGLALSFAAIPILFLLGLILAFCVPCIGVIFCCCRCCESCGGRMEQKDDDNTLCRRAAYALFLLATAILLGVGCASVFLGGKTSVNTVTLSVEIVNTTTADFICYTNSIVKEINFLVDLTNEAVQFALDDLSDTGSAAIQAIVDDVETGFQGVKELDQSARTLKGDLMLITELQNSQVALSNNISSWLDGYEATLNSPDCQGISQCKDLADSFNRAQFEVPSTSINVQPQLETLSTFLARNLTGRADSLLKGLEGVIDTFSANSSDVPDIDITEFTNMIDQLLTPINDQFLNIADYLNDEQFQEGLGSVTEYGFIGAGVFAGFIGLIAVLYILGIIFGEIGRNSGEDPVERQCMANCGGCLLVLGWVISFLFYFIIAVLAALYFLFGSLGGIFVCQPLDDVAQFDQIKNFLLDASGDNMSVNPIRNYSLANTLTACKNNGGLYEALNIDAVARQDFEPAIKELTSGLDSGVSDINITETLNFEGLNDLNNLTRDLDFTGTDFTALQTELDETVPSYNDRVTEIRELEGTLRANGTTAANNLADTLDSHADDLDAIIDNELKAFNDDLAEAQAVAPTLEDRAEKLVGDAATISANVTTIVDSGASDLQQKVNDILPMLNTYVTQTGNHIINEIKTSLGRCRPLYNLYRSIDYIVCDNLINSLNAIWLGLGVGVIFFIFGIIFAVKLSKFYRRMHHVDASRGQDMSNGYDKINYPV